MDKEKTLLPRTALFGRQPICLLYTSRGELRALGDTGPRNINAIVSFNSSVPELRGTVLSVRAVLMGTLVGRSTFMALFLTYKDLLLPFVIAVFGGILAARQAQIQTQRAQIGETWNKMLPISHKLALRYYMPCLLYTSLRCALRPIGCHGGSAIA